MTPPVNASEAKNEVTVLVFKNNLAARTFRVPIRWIGRVGGLLGLAVVVTLISVFFGLKYVRKASLLDPSRLKELEQEIADLETAYTALQAKSLTIEQKKDSEFGKPGSTSPSYTGPVSTLAPRTLSKEIDSLPEGILPRIGISKLRIDYENKGLTVRFNIEYIANDQGNQRGRIVILAKGPSHLLTHPKGIMGDQNSPVLLNVNKGETFSVSRFRRVRADFRPLAHSKVIDTIQILLLNTRNQILINQTISVEDQAQSVSPEETIGPQPSKSQ